MREWKKWAAGAAVSALVALGLTVPAQAATSQPTGPETSATQAMALLRQIKGAADQSSIAQDASPALSDDSCPSPALPVPELKQRVLTSLNAHRAFAKVAPVEFVPDGARAWANAQEAAITIARSKDIDHGFFGSGSTWYCRTATGSDASAWNSLSLSTQWTSGTAIPHYDHVSALVGDWGVPTLGHRINALDPNLAQVIFGSAYAMDGSHKYLGFDLGTAYSNIATRTRNPVLDTWVARPGDYQQWNPASIVNTSAVLPQIVAYPGAGYFPASLAQNRGSHTFEWSFAVPGVEDLSGATVEMQTPGNPEWHTVTSSAVKTSHYTRGTLLGSDNFTGIKFAPESAVTVPSGNDVAEYKVRVTKDDKVWEYSVHMISDSYTPPAVAQPSAAVTQDLPASVDIKATESKNVPFAVSVTGGNGSYVIEKKSGGADWTATAAVTPVAGSADGSITVAKGDFANGDKVRVAVTPEGGQTVYSTAMTVNVWEVPTITIDDPDKRMTEGTQAPTFIASVKYADASQVTWTKQGETDVIGTGSAFTPPKSTLPSAGGQVTYQATVTTKGGSATASATLHVAPAVTGGTVTPQNSEVFEGDTVTFTHSGAAGTGTSLQWYFKPASGLGEWQSLVGQKGATLTLAKVTTAEAGTYRVAVTNAEGSGETVYSTEAVLAVRVQPTLEAVSATAVTVATNKPVTLTVRSNYGEKVTWTKANESASLGTGPSFSPSTAVVGTTTYRASLTVLEQTRTVDFTVTVIGPLALTKAPIAQVVLDGTPVTFTAEANREGATFDWYRTGADASVMTGSSLTIDSPVKGSTDTWKVCASDALTAERICSDAVGYTVVAPLTVANSGMPTQPLLEGARVTLTAVANLDDATHTWQTRTADSQEWTPVPNATSATYAFTVSATDEGRRFRAVARTANPAQEATGADLVVPTVNAKVVPGTVKATPAKVTEGESVALTVSGMKNQTGLRWQRRSNADAQWVDLAGATAPTLTISKTTLTDSGEYRVVATGQGEGNTAATESVVLTVASAPVQDGEISFTNGTVDTQAGSATVVPPAFEVSTEKVTKAEWIFTFQDKKLFGGMERPETVSGKSFSVRGEKYDGATVVARFTLPDGTVQTWTGPNKVVVPFAPVARPSGFAGSGIETDPWMVTWEAGKDLDLALDLIVPDTFGLTSQVWERRGEDGTWAEWLAPGSGASKVVKSTVLHVPAAMLAAGDTYRLRAANAAGETTLYVRLGAPVPDDQPGTTQPGAGDGTAAGNVAAGGKDGKDSGKTVIGAKGLPATGTAIAGFLALAGLTAAAGAGALRVSRRRG